MIAADTSSLVAFYDEEPGADTEALGRALAEGTLALPPVVLTEALSDPALPGRFRGLLDRLDLFPLVEGYWERAGKTRAALLAKGLRARVGDALIAQSCLDHRAPLITRDRDFRAFARHLGLELLVRV